MGLKEKQAIAGLDFSWSEKEIKKDTGTEVKIQVEADTFASDMEAILYADSRGAQRVACGIGKICYNDIGKEAFNEKKISKIVLKNQAPGSRSVTMKDGVLALAFAYASSDDCYSEYDMKEAIENLLG